MTIGVYDNVVPLIEENAKMYGITLEEAANFMLRFSVMHHPILFERDTLMLSRTGERVYDDAAYQRFSIEEHDRTK